MKTFTDKDIDSWEPCYPANEKLPNWWKGNALDILSLKSVSIEDRFWVVLREGCIDDKTLRLFAVWCARRALKRVENPDPRSIEACNVAERFANGRATEDELAVVRQKARSATWAASAAESAARSAAWSAASSAARSASAAASAATRSAAWSARSAAWSAQLRKLKSMLKKGQ